MKTPKEWATECLKTTFRWDFEDLVRRIQEDALTEYKKSVIFVGNKTMCEELIREGLEDTVENRLTKTFFVVEATDAEQFFLWKEWSNQSDKRCIPDGVVWEQVNPGWLITVGKLGKRPCCISVSWVRINGKLVMFWYQCSQVTDSLQAEAWIEKHFKRTYDGGRPSTTDAMNFAHCIHAIRDEK
jgi:hypothetical protein